MEMEMQSKDSDRLAGLPCLLQNSERRFALVGGVCHHRLRPIRLHDQVTNNEAFLHAFGTIHFAISGNEWRFNGILMPPFNGNLMNN